MTVGKVKVDGCTRVWGLYSYACMQSVGYLSWSGLTQDETMLAL